VAPWQGDPYVALLGPIKTGRQPTADEVRRGLNALVGRRVHRAVTPALNPYEAEPFFQAGFTLFERLHLLSCPVNLVNLPRPADRVTPHELRLTAGRPWHDRTVLDVDAQAFSGFWRFDKLALAEAKTATPARRYRIAKLDRQIVGYAVTGRAGHRGYLQRLAVDPQVQGRGLGKALIADSFDWLRARGAHLSLVNTQETNATALGLYEQVGFRRQPEGLLVLQWDAPR
jgi:ribosomal protein S18 acetylase RimI-like enzyme